MPGARSAALAAQVRAAVAGGPDLAVIVVGANDVTHFVPVEHAAEQLAQAVRTLRSAGTRVVVAPAPDLSAIPLLPPQFRALARSVSAQLRAAQTRAAEREGARVAVVDDALRSSFAADPSLFSADRFHPSSRGYEVITRALLPAVWPRPPRRTSSAAGRPRDRHCTATAPPLHRHCTVTATPPPTVER